MSEQEGNGLQISQEDLDNLLKDSGVSEDRFNEQQIPIVNLEAIERGKKMKVKKSDQGITQEQVDNLTKHLLKK